MANFPDSCCRRAFRSNRGECDAALLIPRRTAAGFARAHTTSPKDYGHVGTGKQFLKNFNISKLLFRTQKSLKPGIQLT